MKHLMLISLMAMLASSAKSQPKTYILVHGAWHGAWCWDNMIPLLNTEGNLAIAVDLPGHGKDKKNMAEVTLRDYVKKVKEVANSIVGPVILVGHSMGGVVISQSAEVLGKDKVAKLIFLDAFMPANGESVFSLAEKAGRANAESNLHIDGPTLMESLIFSEDKKTAKLKPENVTSLFYHDCNDKDIIFAKRSLVSQSMACLGTPVQVSAERYGMIPKYYILCTKARDLDKSSLINNVPCEKVFKLESSHSPFFSMPEQLARIIKGI